MVLFLVEVVLSYCLKEELGAFWEEEEDASLLDWLARAQAWGPSIRVGLAKTLRKHASAVNTLATVASRTPSPPTDPDQISLSHSLALPKLSRRTPILSIRERYRLRPLRSGHT